MEEERKVAEERSNAERETSLKMQKMAEDGRRAIFQGRSSGVRYGTALYCTLLNCTVLYCNDVM